MVEVIPRLSYLIKETPDLKVALFFWHSDVIQFNSVMYVNRKALGNQNYTKNANQKEKNYELKVTKTKD